MKQICHINLDFPYEKRKILIFKENKNLKEKKTNINHFKRNFKISIQGNF